MPCLTVYHGRILALVLSTFLYYSTSIIGVHFYDVWSYKSWNKSTSNNKNENNWISQKFTLGIIIAYFPEWAVVFSKECFYRNYALLGSGDDILFECSCAATMLSLLINSYHHTPHSSHTHFGHSWFTSPHGYILQHLPAIWKAQEPHKTVLLIKALGCDLVIGSKHG